MLGFACGKEKYKKRSITMKNKELWKGIIQIVISILTAALTALGTASCLRGM